MKHITDPDRKNYGGKAQKSRHGVYHSGWMALVQRQMRVSCGDKCESSQKDTTALGLVVRRVGCQLRTDIGVSSEWFIREAR